MKAYVFSIGILLMLSFSLTGCIWAAARALRCMSASSPYAALAVGFVALVALVAALAWSVPRG